MEKEKPDGYEIISLRELVNRLQQIWINEKLALELLKTQINFIDCLNEQVASAKQSLVNTKRDDMRAFIRQLELERIQFMIADYLSRRLQKIERDWMYLRGKLLERDKDTFEKLSDEEMTFLSEFARLNDDYMDDVATSKMPALIQTEKDSLVAKAPNLDQFLFCRSLDQTVALEQFTIAPGEKHIVRYRLVRDYINSGQLALT